MKTIWISHCTEYEAGWGQRPDGFMIAFDPEILKKRIEKSNTEGDREIFWRYDEPKELHCDKKTLKKIKVKMESSHEDIAHFSNKDKEGMNLFKQV